MMYIGEIFNSRFLASLNKALIVMAVVFGLGIGALSVAAMLQGSSINSMKEEIESKSKAIVAAQEAAKLEKEKPASEKVPNGLAAVSAFQTRLNKLVVNNKCLLTQFQASDQMNPFVSTFSSAAANGPWTQVEVKMNLQGSTQAVVETLKDLDQIGIPYEFTSVEMSRTQASATGEATIGANVSLRVLTIPGGA
ncbi:MAG TPA: hypothetical protein VHE55_02325 [Fimbriimonadaceae bacterium]|nr:hypothetical protein [Fimbriimonadaceae bacterium]